MRARSVVGECAALWMAAVNVGGVSAQDLKWYKHQGNASGQADWRGPSKVGSGWSFDTILHSSDGVFYATNSNGDLLWYKHTGGADGKLAWAPGTGNKVGSGWAGFQKLFASKPGRGGRRVPLRGPSSRRWARR